MPCISAALPRPSLHRTALPRPSLRWSKDATSISPVILPARCFEQPWTCHAQALRPKAARELHWRGGRRYSHLLQTAWGAFLSCPLYPSAGLWYAPVGVRRQGLLCWQQTSVGGSYINTGLASKGGSGPRPSFRGELKPQDRARLNFIRHGVWRLKCLKYYLSFPIETKDFPLSCHIPLSWKKTDSFHFTFLHLAAFHSRQLSLVKNERQKICSR